MEQLADTAAELDLIPELTPVPLRTVIRAVLADRRYDRLVDMLMTAIDKAGGESFAVHEGVIYPGSVISRVAMSPQEACDMAGVLLETAVIADAVNDDVPKPNGLRRVFRGPQV